VVDVMLRRAWRDWRYPASVAACLFGAAFVLASFGARVGLDNARAQLRDFQLQETCRAELAASVESARDSVAAVDGQLIATFAIARVDEPLSDTRQQQLRGVFADLLSARDALQTVLDDALAAQEQAPEICPG
jgi:hypothetical protein